MTRPTKMTMFLQCALTVAEIQEASRLMADAVRQVERESDNLKSVSAQIRSVIQRHAASIKQNAEKVNSGQEYRDVDCRIEYDFGNREKRVYRLDINELADTVKLTDEELQEDFAGPLFVQPGGEITRDKPEKEG